MLKIKNDKRVIEALGDVTTIARFNAEARELISWFYANSSSSEKVSNDYKQLVRYHRRTGLKFSEPQFVSVPPEMITQNPYCSSVNFTQSGDGHPYSYDSYKKGHMITVCEDHYNDYDTLIPIVSYCAEDISVPALIEDGIVKRSVSPLEINSMSPAIQAAHGRVLCVGMGMGYFQYMCLQSSEVASVTTVEGNTQLIVDFEQNMLPQFKGQFNTFNIDPSLLAPQYVKSFDFAFVNCYSSVKEGMELYVKFGMEWGTNCLFWLQDTIRHELHDELTAHVFMLANEAMGKQMDPADLDKLKDGVLYKKAEMFFSQNDFVLKDYGTLSKLLSDKTLDRILATEV